VTVYKVSYRPFPEDDMLKSRGISAKPEEGTIKSTEKMNGLTTFRVRVIAWKISRDNLD